LTDENVALKLRHNSNETSWSVSNMLSFSAGQVFISETLWLTISDLNKPSGLQ